MSVEKLSDGTLCDLCKRLILTKLGMNYRQDNKNFCCKECADDSKAGKKYEGEGG